MHGKIVIHLTRTPEGVGMKITGTTPEQFAVLLGSFKAALPDWSRDYDADLRLWIVSSGYYPLLRSWCSAVIRRFDARVEDAWSGMRSQLDQASSHLNIEIELALREFGLLPNALDYGPEFLKVVFHYLARQHHPDVIQRLPNAADDGGEKMRSLNHAYEVLSMYLEHAAAA